MDDSKSEKWKEHFLNQCKLAMVKTVPPQERNQVDYVYRGAIGKMER